MSSSQHARPFFCFATRRCSAVCPSTDRGAYQFGVFGSLFDEHLANEIAGADDFGIGDTVVDMGTFAARGDQAFAAQDTQMLGDVGLIEFAEFSQFIDGPFPLAQEIQNLEADGVGKRLAQFGVPLKDSPVHSFSILSNIRNCEYHN